MRSGGLAVCRKNLHPQLGWERNLQLSGARGAWGTGQTDFVPCLRSNTHFGSHQVVKELHICCCVGLFMTSGPGRAEPVGNPSSSCRRLMWGRQKQDENCLWWRQIPWKGFKQMQWDHTELDYNVMVWFAKYESKYIYRVLSAAEHSRTSYSNTAGISVIHEFGFKLSKDISWESWVMCHQKLPMGEKGLSRKILFKCNAEKVVWVSLRFCIRRSKRCRWYWPWQHSLSHKESGNLEGKWDKLEVRRGVAEKILC